MLEEFIKGDYYAGFDTKEYVKDNYYAMFHTNSYHCCRETYFSCRLDIKF